MPRFCVCTVLYSLQKGSELNGVIFYDWEIITEVIPLFPYEPITAVDRFNVLSICRATTRPPRPSSTAECLCLIACLRGEQASAASWEPRPPFEAAEMD